MADLAWIEVAWLDGSKGKARVLGNNAAWICRCGDPMLGTTTYAGPPCACGKAFEMVPEGGKGSKPTAVRER